MLIGYIFRRTMLSGRRFKCRDKSMSGTRKRGRDKDKNCRNKGRNFRNNDKSRRILQVQVKRISKRKRLINSRILTRSRKLQVNQNIAHNHKSKCSKALPKIHQYNFSKNKLDR